jgi:hypothetical protein
LIGYLILVILLAQLYFVVVVILFVVWRCSLLTRYFPLAFCWRGWLVYLLVAVILLMRYFALLFVDI